MALAPKFFYGGYQFNHGEISPTLVRRRSIRSARNVKYQTEFSMQAEGTLCFPDGTQPDDIAARINEIELAFQEDYQDWGFIIYDESDAPSEVHKVENADAFNLSGNKVDEFAWRSTAGATELANTRSFQVTLSAIFESAYSNILDRQETLTFHGTGGPIYEVVPLFNGTFVRKQVAASTCQILTQTGYIDSLAVRGAVPTPIASLAALEMQHLRVIGKPRPKFMGNYENPTFRCYRWDYRFVYKMPPNYSLNPTELM